jgi:small-conductance mechanosensitive channel
MLVFLLILILLAVLGVLGLALKIAAALLLGVAIAVTTVIAVGYFAIRRQLRRAQASLGVQPPVTRSSGTTVEIGQPHREQSAIDDRY